MNKNSYIQQLQVNAITDGDMRINALKGIGAVLDAQATQQNEIEALKNKKAPPMSDEAASMIGGAIGGALGVLVVPLKEAQSENAYFKEQLSRPLMEIINENKEYKETFEKQREILEGWMVSQNAFKKLAFEYGKKNGKNEEEIKSEMLAVEEKIINSGVITTNKGEIVANLRVINKK